MSASTSSQAVQAFLTELGAARKEVSEFQLRNSPDPSLSNKERLEILRRHAIDELSALEAEVNSATAGQEQDELANENTRQIWRVVGNHSGKVQQLDDTPFTVRSIKTNDYVSDIVITARHNVPISDDSGVLKTEIDAAVNVIKTVMSERLRARLVYKRAEYQKAIWETQDDYLKQVQGLACVGLGSVRI